MDFNCIPSFVSSYLSYLLHFSSISSLEYLSRSFIHCILHIIIFTSFRFRILQFAVFHWYSFIFSNLSYLLQFHSSSSITRSNHSSFICISSFISSDHSSVSCISMVSLPFTSSTSLFVVCHAFFSSIVYLPLHLQIILLFSAFIIFFISFDHSSISCISMASLPFISSNLSLFVVCLFFFFTYPCYLLQFNSISSITLSDNSSFLCISFISTDHSSISCSFFNFLYVNGIPSFTSSNVFFFCCCICRSSVAILPLHLPVSLLFVTFTIRNKG